MAFVLENAKRRRLVGKQRAPAQWVLPPGALAALADEAWSEVTAAAEDPRRKHAHWVHVRTNDPAHKQPDTFTRQEFWDHLCRVYKDVYPKPEQPTGSILLFGCVAKERHAQSSHKAERAEHHHAPCYTSEQHYWAPVARRSLELGVKLHAACHSGYTMMYVYVRCPSPKKPVSELDADLWYSPNHPRGKVLSDLLDTGIKATHRFHAARKGAKVEGEGARFRPSDIFHFVQETGVRTVDELRDRAHVQAQEGDKRLAEFCTVHKEDDLVNYLAGAWAVHDAPQRAQAAQPVDRITKLRNAAGWQCTCGGRWTELITFVLQNNGEDVGTFCTDVFVALSVGARRGANIAIIGPPGCGKSTVLEALDLIYKVSGKPQRENTFPLASVMDSEVLLWQEFSWDSKMCSFEDLLSLMAGEKFGIRIPREKPQQVRNTSPMFYTAWAPLTCAGNSAQAVTYTQAMAERFKTRVWTRPLPVQGRVLEFPQCARCFAVFILTNARH